MKIKGRQHDRKITQAVGSVQQPLRFYSPKPSAASSSSGLVMLHHSSWVYQVPCASMVPLGRSDKLESQLRKN